MCTQKKLRHRAGGVSPHLDIQGWIVPLDCHSMCDVRACLFEDNMLNINVFVGFGVVRIQNVPWFKLSDLPITISGTSITSRL